MGISIGLANGWTHLRYSTFNEMRQLLCEAAKYETYGGRIEWADSQLNDVLVYGLLLKCDCEDEIQHHQCADLAKRIKELVPNVKFPIHESTRADQRELIETFVKALERCATNKTCLGWQ